MFDPAKKSTSPEMRKLLEQLEAQKKERSKAVDRLKACADEISKDSHIGAHGPTSDASAGSRSAKDAEPQSEEDTRERLRKSRLARKTTLETLKKTTIRAINDHLTMRYSAEDLERALGEVRVNVNSDGKQAS